MLFAQLKVAKEYIQQEVCVGCITENGIKRARRSETYDFNKITV